MGRSEAVGKSSSIDKSSRANLDMRISLVAEHSGMRLLHIDASQRARTLQAYSQVVMSGDDDVFIVIPEDDVLILPTSWRDKFAARRPVMNEHTVCPTSK